MEVKDGKVTITLEEFRRLDGSMVSLNAARNAIEHVREKDGGLRLPPKCVDMLLKIMEVEG